MAKVKSKKPAKKTPAPVKKLAVDDRAHTEMVMLLIVVLGLAITTIMAFSR